METSENIDLIADALVKAQSEIGIARKDSKNPFFKSSYSSLPEVIKAVKESLNDNGLSLLQPVTEIDGHTAVETRLQHKSGQFMTSSAKVSCAKPNDPQAVASGISYLKRYMIQSLLMLPCDDDDDGERASGKTLLDVFGFVKRLISQKRKTPEQVKAMIKFAGENPEEKKLEDLTKEQLMKIKEALQR